MKLLLPEILKTKSNWRQIVEDKGIIIKEDGHFTMFKYDFITNISETNEEVENSGFMDPIVRECRGIIYDNRTWTPVCVPFFKFGNYTEPYCPEMDLDSVRVEEKIDGSIISTWFYEGEWHVSTSGTIDADKAPVNGHNETFKSIFLKGLATKNMTLDDLPKNHTTMFELVSPETRVVIEYDNVNITHIGSRDMETLDELFYNIDGVSKPKTSNFTTMDAIVEEVNNFPWTKEGYVLVDKYFNRVKVKSPEYVRITKIHGTNLKTKKYERCVNILYDKVFEMDTKRIYKEDKLILEESLYCISKFISEYFEKYDKVQELMSTYPNRGEFIKASSDSNGVFMKLLLKSSKQSNVDVMKTLNTISREKRLELFQWILDGKELLQIKGENKNDK